MALRGKAKHAIQVGVDNHKPFQVGNVRGILQDPDKIRKE